uniref:Uncharacterized protein n=1 Tax=Rhizophora mucronata TaxID=61149 RepID=A0A2P2PL76_RHIMU
MPKIFSSQKVVYQLNTSLEIFFTLTNIREIWKGNLVTVIHVPMPILWQDLYSQQ